MHVAVLLRYQRSTPVEAGIAQSRVAFDKGPLVDLRVYDNSTAASAAGAAWVQADPKRNAFDIRDEEVRRV